MPVLRLPTRGIRLGTVGTDAGGTPALPGTPAGRSNCRAEKWEAEEKKKDKEAKVGTARLLWVPAVNKHGAFGRSQRQPGRLRSQGRPFDPFGELRAGRLPSTELPSTALGAGGVNRASSALPGTAAVPAFPLGIIHRLRRLGRLPDRPTRRVVPRTQPPPHDPQCRAAATGRPAPAADPAPPRHHPQIARREPPTVPDRCPVLIGSVRNPYRNAASRR